MEIHESGSPARQGGLSYMAERIAMHRVVESMLPGGERICFDPYAVRFVNPDTMLFMAKHHAEARVLKRGKKSHLRSDPKFYQNICDLAN